MNSSLKIGISAKFHNKAPVFYGESNRHIQYLETSMASWVAHNKALPLMIPSESTNSDFQVQMLNAKGFAEELDGLILQGGVDVDPTIYQKDKSVTTAFPTDIVRDRYELSLIKAFIEQKKPILGICRGLQLINVYFGGTLISDLESQGYSKHLDKSAEESFSHDIEIMNDGVLSKIYPRESKVSSIHHQGIDVLGEGLFKEAISKDDGLIEAVSIIDEKTFVLAVQWHPEFHDATKEGFLNADQLLKIFTKVVYNRKFYGDLSYDKKKTIKFSKSDALTLGTEIEMQVIDPVTLDLTPKAPDLLASLNLVTHKIKSEIFQSMIEIETDVCNDANQVESDLLETSFKLLAEAKKQNLLIGSTGTHPFARYSERILTPNNRYTNLIDSKQWIARRISIFGLHCHVGVKSPEQGIELYRFYLSIAPLLLSVSASSPFFQGEDTGLHSVRSTFFESMPSGGHPPILNNWMEFQGLMTKMLKSKSISSHKDLWWDVRPSLNYGTIEIRICDSMPTIKENAALVALIHLLGHAYLNFKDYKEWPKLSDWSYRENKWRALRYGLDFEFIFNEEGNCRPAKEFLLMLIEDFSELSQEFGYGHFIEIIKQKMLRTTSAQRQYDEYQKTGDFKSVVQQYCGELITGLKENNI
jgi:glutamate---cysteine ligase / carboxylate-amine ligase